MPMISDFRKALNVCDKYTSSDFYGHEGFLFKRDKLYVHICFVGEYLVREMSWRGLYTKC